MLAEPSCQRSQLLQWMRSSAAVALLDKPLQAELTAAENQWLTSFRSSLALLQRVRRTGEDQAPEHWAFIDFEIKFLPNLSQISENFRNWRNRLWNFQFIDSFASLVRPWPSFLQRQHAYFLFIPKTQESNPTGDESFKNYDYFSTPIWHFHIVLYE